MALRWSLTSGAYNKYAHHFKKQLPIVIPAKAPIAEASHIRDVIRYAKEHNLPGGELFKNCTVSPQENNTVIIFTKESTTIPTHSIFELMAMLSEDKLPSGYKAIVTDGKDAILSIASAFPSYHIAPLYDNVVRFTKIGD